MVLSWNNFDTGKDDARAALYVDGNFIGQLTGRQIAMNWNLDKAGIYVAVSYLGLLDELISAEEFVADAVRQKLTDAIVADANPLLSVLLGGRARLCNCRRP